MPAETATRHHATWERLTRESLWRQVDAEHNARIIECLAPGSRVLDLGCGYGSLTHALWRRGFDVLGIDIDETFIRTGRQAFPDLPADRYAALPLSQLAAEGRRFDAVVMRDTMHHLYEECPIDSIMGDVERVLAPGGRLVVFDPQPNWVVKVCRRIIGHRDAECSARQARDLLRARGWRIERMDFTEAIGLPLSGGYVGREWIPPRPELCRAVVGLNRVLSVFLNAVGLGPVLLWRYRLVAVRDSA